MATDGGPGNDLKMLISPTYFSVKPHFLNVLEPPQAELTGKTNWENFRFLFSVI